MKNIVVIGGASGIGKAILHGIEKSENRVFATYRSSGVFSEENVSFHHLDVESTEMDFSYLPEKIDGLVYCPGNIHLAPFHRIKPVDFLNDYTLQVVGAIQVIQAILPRLKAAETSSIVLFSTVAVQTGFNFHSQVAASKGAIEGLTRALAAEFAPTIRVNAIAPSITNTPLASKFLSSPEKIQANAERHPLKKIGNAEDLAEMALFLLSNKAAWITGQIMHVDGGISVIR
jgi:NAD(P)-dependent dehydrogenase (short-subunit alcohol dehydrogenase family)